MSNLKIARPYSKAVFSIAKESKDLEKWSAMLNIAQAVAKNPIVIKALKNPTISKMELIDLFFDVGQDEFTPEMKNFILVLGRFGRLSYLPEIASLYETYRQEIEQIVPVEFISAVPIDANFQSRLISALKRRLEKDVDLACTTDQSLLGGAIIRSGDLIIDGSVRGKLAKLSDTITY